MKGNHAPPSGKREGSRRPGSRRAVPQINKKLLIAGWVFLGIVLVLAVVTVIRLLPEKETAEPPRPTYNPGPAGSAFGTGQEAPALTTEEGQGGRTVIIGGIDCDYTPPAEITFGELRGVDLTALAETVAENARDAGWGEITWSGGGSELILRSVDAPVLSGNDFEKQTAFLASGQPENLARTFLENSGLIPLMRQYGLSLSTQAENDDGQIIFHGTGDAPQTECSVRFSFLYTGAFNQAVIRAVYLADPVTTDQIQPLARAASQAVTWTAGTEEPVRVTAVELRHIRGLPFYVFTCDDGTVAYALAVKESALEPSPNAANTYRSLLASGIREYVEISGAE